MKRLYLIGLVLMAMLGCGGGSSERSTEGAAPAPGPALTAGNPHFMNTIVMTKNNGAYEGGVNPPQAACVGIVIDGRPRSVKRKHKVRWLIENDKANPCPNLNGQLGTVELHFENKIMSQGTSTSDMELDVLTADVANSWIEGRVHADPAKAPDNAHAKYVVFYMQKKASPDPELDIQGDCPTCGPN